jgi:hypothetical protein
VLYGLNYAKAAIAEQHEGNIVRPGDDDGTPTEADDELVAQIIPLRRRDQASGTQTLPDKQSGRFPRTDDPLPPAERSVWDQPTTELRRRTPARTRPDAPEHRNRAWTSERPRSLKVAATVFASVLCVGLLTLTLATLKGRSAPAPARAQGSARGAIAASNQAGAASRRSSRSPVSSSRGRARHETRRNARPRAHQWTGATKRAASTTPTVEPTIADAGAATRSGNNTAPPTESPPPSQATDPPPAQTRCVPGELGC